MLGKLQTAESSGIKYRDQGCVGSPGGSGRSSLGGCPGQCGDTDSDSFQGPRQYSNRSSVLMLLGKGA